MLHYTRSHLDIVKGWGGRQLAPARLVVPTFVQGIPCSPAPLICQLKTALLGLACVIPTFVLQWQPYPGLARLGDLHLNPQGSLLLFVSFPITDRSLRLSLQATGASLNGLPAVYRGMSSPLSKNA